MKLFFTTTIAFCLFFLASSAQTNTFPTSGNVGIGTTTPSAKLHVVTAEVRLTGIGTTGIASGGVYSIYDSNNTTRLGYFGDASTGNSDMYLRADIGALNFSSSSGSMYLSTTGSLGIGTVTPLTVFHTIVPVAKTTTTGSVISLLSTNEATNPFGLRTIIKGGATIADRYAALQTTDYNLANGGSILLNPNGGVVGIGTTTPDQMLTVNGTVHSKAVVVDNSIFPDYVFKKTYVLRPLSAVKAYIDLNHHLPEMPSAAEVAKNGQNLGEINALLLKKVEELTLYMIELNKTVKAQQQEIEQLKKKN